MGRRLCQQAGLVNSPYPARMRSATTWIAQEGEGRFPQVRRQAHNRLNTRQSSEAAPVAWLPSGQRRNTSIGAPSSPSPDRLCRGWLRRRCCANSVTVGTFPVPMNPNAAAATPHLANALLSLPKSAARCRSESDNSGALVVAPDRLKSIPTATGRVGRPTRGIARPGRTSPEIRRSWR